jgi:NADPH2:quinone reductase
LKGVRAVLVSEFGPPEVLVPTDVPDPLAEAGQAVIDVEIANITFVETQLRAGKAPQPSMAPRLPVIPGNGVGGVVAEVGDGVDATLVGTRVITSTGGSGGYAERVAVDSAGVIPVPEGVGLPEAVALLADGRTAMSLMLTAEVRPNESVLVEAAAGGVGSLLVQLSARAGARVIGAVGGERKLRVARELGADEAVDYTQPGWTESVRDDVDVVFDGVGGAVGRAAFELVRPGGRFSAFGLASGTFTDISEADAARREVTVIRSMRLEPERLRELSRAALAEAEAGRLRPLIGQTFPLERAAEAQAAIEARATVGKTLLLVNPR